MAFEIIGAALPRTAGIIERLSDSHKIEAAAIDAVIQVESRGRGFAPDRRLIILPERHVVYRLLPADKRAKAVRLGLARANWNKAVQYKDLASQEARWAFLGRVADFAGVEIACRCASWGAPQIMGNNFAALRFPSAEAMVRGFAAGEDEQLHGMLTFIAAKGLDDELREHDWVGFALGYNGASALKNNYPTLMRHAYEASPYRKTAIVVPAWREKAAAAGETVLKLGSQGAEVKALQERISGLGLGLTLAPDGVYGLATKRAVIAFQAANGLKADGMVGPVTREALASAIPAPPREVSRAEVVTESRAAQSSVAGATIGTAVTGLGAVKVVADALAPSPIAQLAGQQSVSDVATTIETISRTTDPLERIITFAEAHPVFLLAAVATVVCWLGFERLVAAARNRNGVKV